MRSLFRTVLVVCAACASFPGHGYEVVTHEKMSREAVKASALFTKSSGVGANLGLSYAVDDGRQSFPNSNGIRTAVIDLFVEGSNFEDGSTRFLSHFYDPIYNRPLTVFGVELGQRSPDWALEDSALFTAQQYSYKDAREYFYKALTLPSKAERDKHFGLTFQTLGQVIHHVQDMAQPQHTRNDAHPPGSGHRGLYESHTDRPEVRGGLPYTGYGSVLFSTPRRFWTSGDGRGIAEFTNTNFVSAGTNYELQGGQPASNRQYFNPQPTRFGQALLISALLAEEGQTTTLSGAMDFVENEVWDRNTGHQVTNPRSASYSIFDADLTNYNATVTYTWLGPRVTIDRLFTLNRFNFKAAYPHLIPKAVGYSAEPRSTGRSA